MCYCESPRVWDNLGTMLTWESRCHSPDENDYSNPTDYLECTIYNQFPSVGEEIFESKVVKAYGYGAIEFSTCHYIYTNMYKGNLTYLQWLQKKLEETHLFQPVYKYDHSGVVYNTTGFSCPWDSGQCGYIFVEKSKIRELYAVKRISHKLKQQIYDTLDAEVKSYSNWACGECCNDWQQIA